MRIKLISEKHGNKTQIWIDGHDVSQRVRAVDLRWEVGRLNIVRVEFLPDELEIDGEAVSREKSEGWPGHYQGA